MSASYPSEFLVVVGAAFGLVVGSYLNVVIHRLPLGLSTVRPGSRCPRCRSAIRPWDNVPVLSYLLLRGRCRRCGAAIPWRYPLIEASTAGLFVLSVLRFADHPLEMVVACGFCAAMVVLAMIDLDHRALPTVLTLPGIAVGLALQWALSWSSFGHAVVGAAGGLALVSLLSWLWRLWSGSWGLGAGDAHLLGMVGAFLGWKGGLLSLFLASLAGGLAAAGLFLAGRLDAEGRLPFGTFLALGAVVSLLAGREIFGVLGI